MKIRRYRPSVARSTYKRSLLIVCALFVFASLGLSRSVQWFHTKLSAQSKASFPQHTWDGSSQLNLLLYGTPLTLLSYQPRTGLLTAIEIPGNVTLQVGNGYGRYRLSALYELGELEGRRQGMLMSAHAVSMLFGIPIDGYIRMHTQSEHNLFSFLRDRAKIPIGLLPQIESNLSTTGVLKVLWSMAWARFDKIQRVTLTEGETLKRIQQADGTYEITPDIPAIDAIAQRLLFDEEIAKERYRVIVRNATNHTGLGSFFGRRLRNSGALVVAIENAPRSRAKTQLMGSPSYTLNRIRTMLTLTERSGSPVEQEPASRYNAQEDAHVTPDARADIIIEVGEDEWEQTQ